MIPAYINTADSEGAVRRTHPVFMNDQRRVRATTGLNQKCLRASVELVPGHNINFGIKP